MAPASASREIAVASADGTRSLKSGEPHVVGTPFVSRRSLAAYGIPCSGWRGMPDFRSASARRAAASAPSRMSVATAFSFRPGPSRRARHSSVSATDVVLPEARVADNSGIVAKETPAKSLTASPERRSRDRRRSRGSPAARPRASFAYRARRASPRGAARGKGGRVSPRAPLRRGRRYALRYSAETVSYTHLRAHETVLD